MQRSWPHNALSLCTTAIAIAATPTVFVALESAIRNWNELTLGTAELPGLLALPFALLAALVFAVGAALMAVAGSRGLALLTALLVCLWLQSQFFVWDYGVFDGSPIDWTRNAGKGVLEIAVWLTCFAVAVRWPDALARRATWIALACIAVQTAALVVAFQAAAPLDARKSADSADLAALQRDSVQGVTSFSSDRNVIVIVLDTLQSDFFSELLGDADFAARVPPGFVFFRNAVAPYPHTQHSLPSMLTSQLPLRQVPPRWTIERMQASVPALLARQGWGSAVITTTPPYLACNHLRSAFQCESQRFFVSASEKEIAQDFDAIADARSLLRIGAFRATPHLLKAWVYDSGRWRVPDPYPADVLAGEGDSRIWHESRRDLQVWDVLTREAHASGSQPRFKFLHFFGAHHPSSIDAHCEWNGLDNPTHAQRDETMTRDRRFAVGAAQCSLTRAFAFLEHLDELGLYDQSLVFIVGDHGRQHSQIDLAAADPPIPATETAGTEAAARPDEAPPHMSKGGPLLLAKRVGERELLRMSDAAVSLCDLPRSIFAELALEDAFECESIFEIGAQRASPRLHFRGMPYYETPFSVYRVDGHSWLSGSWRRAEPAEPISPR